MPETLNTEDKEALRIHPLDEIPKISFDEAKLINLFETEKRQIDSARSRWLDRKLTYLSQWDDFLDYKHNVLLKNQRYIHIPVTFEKLQAWHSRMFKTIFSMDPVFHMEPLNKVTREEMEATKLLLQWYLRDEINRGDGLKPVIDELLWDLGTDGWGCLMKRWEKIGRVVRDLIRATETAGEELREVASEIKKRGRPRKRLEEYREIRKVVDVFNGVLLETVPQESIYFQEHIPTSGDLEYPKLVMVEMIQDEDSIRTKIESGLYDREAGEAVLANGKGYEDQQKIQLRDERKRLQGIERQASDYQNEYQTFMGFYRADLDGDKYPEEYIFTYSLKAKRILRATYLDRVCRDYARPIYKFDLIKRPRTGYSRGFVETLYSLNEEIDDFHNLRRVSGMIANVPWGFYRSGSGLDKEPIEVSPGVFYPVDDPQTDVRPMAFQNVTGWALQEEGLAQQLADRITSMPGYLQGSVSGPIGPLRSTSGLNTLLRESQAPLDVYLERFRIPFGKMMRGILSDLQARLPHTVTVRVLGEKSGFLYDQAGEVRFVDITKEQYSGKYKFSLAANDAQYNPEVAKQEAMLQAQTLITPFAVQSGVVSPENIYNIYKKMLLKMGEVDPDSMLTPPQIIPRPSNFWEEYSAIIGGRFPMILMNDDHETKIKQLVQISQSPEYAEGKALKNIHPLADLIMAQVIDTHARYQKLIAMLQAMPNQSGLEIPTSIGARSVGMGPNQEGAPAQPEETANVMG